MNRITVLAAAILASASVNTLAAVNMVPVEAVVAVQKNETEQQVIDRIKPVLEMKALTTQPGLVARIVLDKDDQVIQRTRQIQAGITGSTVDGFELVDAGHAKVKMTFTVDTAAGQEYQKIAAEIEILKAKLDDGATALADDKTGHDLAYQKFSRRIAELEAKTRAAGAAGASITAEKLAREIADADGTSGCAGLYQIDSVSDKRYGENAGGYWASATVVIGQKFDSCVRKNGNIATFYLVSWFGKTRTTTHFSTAIGAGTQHIARIEADTSSPYMGDTTMGFQKMHAQDDASSRIFASPEMIRGGLLNADMAGGTITVNSAFESGTGTMHWTANVGDVATNAAQMTVRYNVMGVPKGAFSPDDELHFGIVMLNR